MVQKSAEVDATTTLDLHHVILDLRNVLVNLKTDGQIITNGDMMVDRKIEISSIFSDFEMFLFLGSCFSKLTLTARNADQCLSINWQFPSPHSIH